MMVPLPLDVRSGGSVGAGVGGGVPQVASSQDVHWQSCRGPDTPGATHLLYAQPCSATQDSLV